MLIFNEIKHFNKYFIKLIKMTYILITGELNFNIKIID